MKVCVVLEYRFAQTPDGAVWKETSYPHRFWDKYLSVFDGVRVVARLRQVPVPPELGERADVDRVEFVPIPYFLGPWQYLARMPAVRRAMRRAIGPSDAVLLRVPSQLASVLVAWLQRQRRPYAVEVVGDPYDVFAPGAVDHPLRPLLRWHFARNLRRQCLGACAASYVTSHALQRRYPPAEDVMSIHYSCVQLNGFAAETPRSMKTKRKWRLVTVGSLAQRYKGFDTLVDAMAICVSQGHNLELVILGDGQYLGELKEQVTAAGLENRVHFRGQLPAGDAVGAELAQADLFVLPSRTEGLPRAMVEAMACALPCIGSNVGGIPELLPPEDLVAANDPPGLAAKIAEVLGDTQRMTRMSQQNLERSREFREDVVASRRVAFYEHLRAATQAWLEQGRQPGQETCPALLEQRPFRMTSERRPHQIH